MNPPFIFFLILPSKSFASGPLLRNDNLGGKFQKGTSFLIQKYFSL